MENVYNILNRDIKHNSGIVLQCDSNLPLTVIVKGYIANIASLHRMICAFTSQSV